MDPTPRSLRLHIGLFGKRNAGKSRLLNVLTNRTVAIVSNHPGTTTDPVEKAMELRPIGPVVFIDTAGLDDTGEVGQLRIRQTRQVMEKTELALLVAHAGSWDATDQKIADELRKKKIPTLIVFTASDIDSPDSDTVKKLEQDFPVCVVSSETGEGLENLRTLIARHAPEESLLPRASWPISCPKTGSSFSWSPSIPQPPKDVSSSRRSRPCGNFSTTTAWRWCSVWTKFRQPLPGSARPPISW